MGDLHPWFYIDHSNKWKSDTEAAFVPNICKTSICRLFTELSIYCSEFSDLGKTEMCLVRHQVLLHTPYVNTLDTTN